MQTICETLLDLNTGADLHELVERTRQALGRSLVRPLLDQGVLRVLALSPEVEQEVRGMLNAGPEGKPVAPDPRSTQSLINRVAEAVSQAPPGGQPAVLCGGGDIRAVMRRLTEGTLPNLAFLSVFEIPETTIVKTVGVVR